MISHWFPPMERQCLPDSPIRFGIGTMTLQFFTLQGMEKPLAWIAETAAIFLPTGPNSCLLRSKTHCFQWDFSSK